MVVLLAAGCAVAEQPDVGEDNDTTNSCLEMNLSQITSDKRITLFKTEGTKIDGQLVSADFTLSQLHIHELYRTDRGYSTYRFGEIEKVRFRKRGHLKAGWMIVGLVGGAVIGGFIGRKIDNAGSGSWCGTQTQGIATGLGIIVVGGVGFLTGTIVPLILSSKVVDCQLDDEKQE